MQKIWQSCLDNLQDELTPQQFGTWIRPLQVNLDLPDQLMLQAPNRFIMDWVQDKYLDRITNLVRQLNPDSNKLIKVNLSVIKATTTYPLWSKKTQAGMSVAQKTPSSTEAYKKNIKPRFLI